MFNPFLLATSFSLIPTGPSETTIRMNNSVFSLLKQNLRNNLFICLFVCFGFFSFPFPFSNNFHHVLLFLLHIKHKNNKQIYQICSKEHKGSCLRLQSTRQDVQFSIRHAVGTPKVLHIENDKIKHEAYRTKQSTSTSDVV